ncbi:MAG: RNA polymerase factor sigma-54 [Pelotomaculum sp.]|jgi:RNA polymerase sigma-54 factor
MRIGFNLNVEQSQKLIMTPELREAITVLQLSYYELSSYIERQFAENPLLEFNEDDSAPLEDKQAEPVDKLEEGGLDWEEYFRYSDSGAYHRERIQDRLEYSYEQFLPHRTTLSEHLLLQLSMISCQGQEKKIAGYLIGNIDANGYLRVSLPEVCARLHITGVEAERALSIVQGFEPAGVGARDLAECLLLQVNQLGIKNTTLTRLIKEHLVDLSKGKLNYISQVLGVTVQEVQGAVDILHTLDPKPGRNFAGGHEARLIIPDIILEKVDDEYMIIVNDSSLPRLTINNAYHAVLGKDKNCDLGARRYVESKLNAAAWLLRSIEQRRLTLYKVTECLVELQRDFLEHGVKYLKPLTLKDVAERVGLHESTVSRATANKYIQTPQGVFEMKYFFPTGLNSLSGTATSAESTKKILQEIIAGEDATRPLDDQKIADLLAEKGILISRRTVAKYRSQLNIPSIRQRKRY